MFSHGAFSVVARNAAASVRPLPVDLDLSGPNRPSTVVVDEEPEASPISLLDLAASLVPSALDFLPPAATLTAEQEDFRRQTLDEVRLAFEVSAASGAVRTYEAILRGIAPKAALKLGSSVLPMSTVA